MSKLPDVGTASSMAMANRGEGEMHFRISHKQTSPLCTSFLVLPFSPPSSGSDHEKDEVSNFYLGCHVPLGH